MVLKESQFKRKGPSPLEGFIEVGGQTRKCLASPSIDYIFYPDDEYKPYNQFISSGVCETLKHIQRPGGQKREMC